MEAFFEDYVSTRALVFYPTTVEGNKLVVKFLPFSLCQTAWLVIEVPEGQDRALLRIQLLLYVLTEIQKDLGLVLLTVQGLAQFCLGWAGSLRLDLYLPL